MSRLCHFDKNADIAPGNTYASTDVSTSNNYKQQRLFIGKVGVLIVLTLCNTVHTQIYNSADDKLSTRDYLQNEYH